MSLLEGKKSQKTALYCSVHLIFFNIKPLDYVAFIATKAQFDRSVHLGGGYDLPKGCVPFFVLLTFLRNNLNGISPHYTDFSKNMDMKVL